MGWVLFFDGDCAFCSKSVRRVVAFDKQRRISFAPLQGKLAAELGFTQYAATTTGGTMILLREADGQIFMKSGALVELANALGGGWRLLALARLIPTFLRDGVYDWIAKNRYRFAGKSDSCALPDPEFLKRLRD